MSTTALLLLARVALGVHAGWGAFADDAPRRCFALAEPRGKDAERQGRPYASIATWPGGARNQLYLRLSRPRDLQAKVTLSIGERRFKLLAARLDAWAPDAATDRAIVAAMRSGRSMSVETLAGGGKPFADVYALKGAATAIDAAALRCALRG
jgi:hypothetical protein